MSAFATTIQPRRSIRLIEKNVKAKITALFAENNVDTKWVFDDELFERRWEHEQMLTDLHTYTPYFNLHYDFDVDSHLEEKIDRLKEELPPCSCTKEQAIKIVRELLSTSEKFKHIGRQMMITVMMRFIHSPGRLLLTHTKFRDQVKWKCSDLPLQAMKIHGLNATEYSEKFYDACGAVAAVIDAIEKDTYDVYHGL